ncbi:MAG: HNH endonuclease [Reyranella sp.]|uniref:HNH endonuclease n=1 Tax=Reyranella sp. TaxID=1929291 RepID=UPI0012085F3F|nr:hypothetical protein [Reyranella sp.]TAJ42431.1 MAG: HNH endonuclease [Reyranella sp.]
MEVVDDDTGLPFDLYVTDEIAQALREHYNRCQHEKTDIREVTLSNGAQHFYRQCLRCGELTRSAIAKISVAGKVPPKDEGICERWKAQQERAYANMMQRFVRAQRSESDEWSRSYDEYLKSPQWRSKRDKVLKRASGTCEGCGERPATQVHHLTYKHVREEFLFELVALCDVCHDRIHPKPDLDEGIEHVCAGCRWQSSEDYKDWCAQFEVAAVAALAEGGQCGKDRKGYEPLR